MARNKSKKLQKRHSQGKNGDSDGPIGCAEAKDGKIKRTRQRNGQKRHRKAAPQAAVDVPSVSSIADEIQEQLCQQRELQRQRSAGSDVEEKKKPKRLLGGYVYDEEREAYFPIESLPSNFRTKASTQHDDDAPQFPCARKRSFPFLSINGTERSLPKSNAAFSSYHHWAQMCASPLERQKLLSEWSCQTELARLSLRGWPHEHIPCVKMQGLPLWCRSFDVAEPVAGPGALSSHFLTLVDGMAYLRNSNQEPSSSSSSNPFPLSIDYYSVRFLTGRTNSETFAVAIERDHGNDPQVKSFLMAAQVGTTHIFGTALAVEANDAIRLPNSKKIVVAANYDSKYKGRPWIDGSASSVRNFPTSDALCVDTLASQQQSSVAVFGHRNGQITILDDRSSRCSFTNSHKSPRNEERSLGNIINLFPVPESCGDALLVARGSNGCCRLFDVRKMGTDHQTMKSSSGKDDDPSAVHDFVVPESGTNRWTQQCRGVTVSGTAVLFPWVDVIDTSSSSSNPSSLVRVHHQPRLGVWSLHSGRFLGAKPVGDQFTTVPDAPVEQNGAKWLELCPTVTKAYGISEATSSTSSTVARSESINASKMFWMRSWNRFGSDGIAVNFSS